MGQTQGSVLKNMLEIIMIIIYFWIAGA